MEIYGKYKEMAQNANSFKYHSKGNDYIDYSTHLKKVYKSYRINKEIKEKAQAMHDLKEI